VITEHAVRSLGLQTTNNGWLIQTPQALTAAQITNGRLAASAAGMSVETKNDQPTSDEILNWATVFGVLLALGVLAMTVGLIRSETASDLRILTAAGAGSSTRRSLTAATAGALALLGALFGTLAGYVAVIAFLSDNALDGLGSLHNVPARNLLIILVGMPLVAWAAGWVLAGREPHVLTHQPLE
jgi:putative ABC transport system permease protein